MLADAWSLYMVRLQLNGHVDESQQSTLGKWYIT